MLAIGLSSLTIPTILWALNLGLLPIAVFLGALGALLIRGLRSPATETWLAEP